MHTDAYELKSLSSTFLLSLTGTILSLFFHSLSLLTSLMLQATPYGIRRARRTLALAPRVRNTLGFARVSSTSEVRTALRWRAARHSLFDRYMKALLRLAGGRRKLGQKRIKFRRVFGPTEYLRDLRDHIRIPYGNEI